MDRWCIRAQNNLICNSLKFVEEEACKLLKQHKNAHKVLSVKKIYDFRHKILNNLVGELKGHAGFLVYLEEDDNEYEYVATSGYDKKDAWIDKVVYGGLPLFFVPVVMRVHRTYSPCLEEGGA